MVSLRAALSCAFAGVAVVAASQITAVPQRAAAVTDDTVGETCGLSSRSRWSHCLLDDQDAVTVEDDRISGALNCVCCDGSTSLWPQYSSCFDLQNTGTLDPANTQSVSEIYDYCSRSADCAAFAATATFSETSDASTTDAGARPSEDESEALSPSDSGSSDVSSTSTGGSDSASETGEPDAASHLRAGSAGALAGIVGLVLYI